MAQSGDDDQLMLVVGGTFGVAGGKVGELLEPVEAMLDLRCIGGIHPYRMSVAFRPPCLSRSGEPTGLTVPGR